MTTIYKLITVCLYYMITVCLYYMFTVCLLSLDNPAPRAITATAAGFSPRCRSWNRPAGFLFRTRSSSNLLTLTPYPFVTFFSYRHPRPNPTIPAINTKTTINRQCFILDKVMLILKICEFICPSRQPSIGSGKWKIPGGFHTHSNEKNCHKIDCKIEIWWSI